MHELENTTVRERVAFADAVGACANGRGYRVALLAAGVSKNGWEFPAAVLQAGAPLFEGVTSLVDHAGWHAHPRVSDVLGTVHRVAYDAGAQALLGDLHLAPTGAWLAPLLEHIIAERTAGRAAPNVGMSADLEFTAQDKRVERIVRVHSVDLVFDPAAGGQILRALGWTSRGTVMTPSPSNQTNPTSRGTVIALSPSNHTNSTSRGVVMAPSPSNHTNPTSRGTVIALSPSNHTNSTGGEMEGITKMEPANHDGDRTADALLRMQCAATLTAVLAASDLPEPFKATIRERFDGKVFAPSELQEEMERGRALWAAALESRTVQGMGQAFGSDKEHSIARRPAVQGMWTELDRLQLATDRLFGIELPEAFQDTPRLRGIQELYLLTTGDREFTGIYRPERVQFANATTSTMAGLVANAMNKVIPAQWQKLGRAGYLWWQKIAYQDDFGSINDVKWITVGGFGDLPTVAEGAAYTELTWDDNTETTAFVKKGGYIGITLEMMDRDQTNKVRAIPVGIATAALRTLSNSVAALFTSNPNLADGIAWFHTNHANRGGDGATAGSGNLGSTALSAAEWDVAVQKIFNKTELNSSKRLGLRPRYLLIPIELEKTALQIFVSPTEPSSNAFYTNVRQSAAENVVIVPEWTDANDWAAITDPDVYPCVGVGFRYGRMPEVFSAGEDTIGSMFTNDELRIKSRFFYAAGVIDWRGVRKYTV